MMKQFSLVSALLALALASGFAQQQPPPQPPQGQTQGGRGQGRGGQGSGQGGGQRQNPQNPQGQQPRDRQTQTPVGTSSITGRVLTADTGRPVKRAQVFVTGGGRGGRGATTDEHGVYAVSGLAAGTYTITASKNGFVDAVFGQRRPLQPGTPVPLADNQQAVNVDLRLTRGGVITGRVLDEDGEALARALVTVQRYQYVGGNRQLSPVGGDQTDDRGVYRVFGLPPGDYYVSVSVSGLGQMLGRGLQQLAAGVLGGGGRGGRGGIGGLLSSGMPDESEPSGYAPTYYPGVVSSAEAGRIAVGPGQEVGGIDFQIQLVPLATVGGVVAGTDESVTVMLVPQDANARAPLGGATFTGRTQQDGGFSITNVPPGRYVAVARSGGGRQGAEPRTAVQSVIVNGQNIGGLALLLQPGVAVSGNITVESSGTPAPTDYSAFRVDAPEMNPLPMGPGGGRGGFATAGRAAANGSFQVPNLLPGRHYIRVTGQGLTQGMTTPTQWTLKSVLVGGTDVTDAGFDLKPGENVDNVTIVLSDRSTDVSGTVRDAKGAPGSALTVIAFSADPQFWRSQSRFIQPARTDQNGAYRMHGLPPGDYFVLVTDNVEQGEWFDPSFLEQARQSATRTSLSEGEKKTLDLSGPS